MINVAICDDMPHVCDGYKTFIDIEDDIYSKYSVLRLLYSDTYEIDIIFGENSVLDVIYVEDGKTSCFYAFDNKVQDEIQEYVENIQK